MNNLPVATIDNDELIKEGMLKPSIRAPNPLEFFEDNLRKQEGKQRTQAKYRLRRAEYEAPQNQQLALQRSLGTCEILGSHRWQVTREKRSLLHAKPFYVIIAWDRLLHTSTGRVGQEQARKYYKYLPTVEPFTIEPVSL